MQQIYEKIDTVKDKFCEIGISYLEVYNETVIDLLSPGGLSKFLIFIDYYS